MNVTKSERDLLNALNRNPGQQYLPKLRQDGALSSIVQDTLWARTAGTLVCKGLVSRGKRHGSTVYQITEAGLNYLVPDVAPSHVVVDTRDGYVFNRSSALDGALFTLETATRFAGQRNAEQFPRGTYVVRALVPVPAVPEGNGFSVQDANGCEVDPGFVFGSREEAADYAAERGYQVVDS